MKKKRTTTCTRNRTCLFIPLVMSDTGGLAKEATNFHKRLASLLADKWDQSYCSSTMYWLRCSLSFSLLRSAIQCIRARSSRGHPIKLSPVDLVIAEAGLQPEWAVHSNNRHFCFPLLHFITTPLIKEATPKTTPNLSGWGWDWGWWLSNYSLSFGPFR